MIEKNSHMKISDQGMLNYHQNRQLQHANAFTVRHRILVYFGACMTAALIVFSVAITALVERTPEVETLALALTIAAVLAFLLFLTSWAKSARPFRRWRVSRSKMQHS